MSMSLITKFDNEDEINWFFFMWNVDRILGVPPNTSLR